MDETAPVAAVKVEEEQGRRAKRRRVVSDKKYVCPYDGCDNAYSRSEHLHRHELNHNPSTIYECEICERRFARSDLWNRHFKRHEERKSDLARTTRSKYDLDITHASESAAKVVRLAGESASRRRSSTFAFPRPPKQEKSDAESPLDAIKHEPDTSSQSSSQHAVSLDPRLADNQAQGDASNPLNTQAADAEASSALDPLVHPVRGPAGTTASHFDYRRHSTTMATLPPHTSPPIRTDSAPAEVQYPASMFPTSGHPPRAPREMPMPTYQPSYDNQQLQRSFPFVSPSVDVPRPASAFPSMAILPAFNNTSVSHDPHSSIQSSMLLSSSTIAGPLFPPSLQQLTAAYQTVPVFNNDVYNNAQFQSNDDFNSWLFATDAGWMPADSVLMDPESTQAQFGDLELGNFGVMPLLDGTGDTPKIRSSTPRETYPSTGKECDISHERWQRLLSFVIDEFHDREHVMVTEQRKKILQGDHELFPHVLSLHMLQEYLSSFWSRVYHQIPILHRPTYNAETCPDLLLLAQLALGASNLDKSHPFERRQLSSDLSFFFAWHIRLRIFGNPDWGPPAKLWIFQALLLLEVFEKMYSTRTLHERGHIHHGTTITLMRRGSSLVGRYAMDFPPYDDPTRTPPGPNGSINLSGTNTQDEEWNVWISQEATRRVAFAAFLIDTTHANMFSHSAVMVAHEMRIALPCDEAMWSATSMTEVHRIRQSLEAVDYKQISFLDAVKMTLNGQQVRTNTFGRVSIMAGLLSVSWHMKMQDVRVSSVGVGKQGSWGKQLLYAFDYWKRDFDNSLSSRRQSRQQEQQQQLLDRQHLPTARINESSIDEANVYESRTVLHHLAHMTMHCDILDCQKFAGATRLLGRVITPQDRQVATRQIREWAPSARARDATFFALGFLYEVLMPSEDSSQQPAVSASVAAAEYIARDDFLLNRPWVMYIAMLVVWSYGYALDGPIKAQSYSLSTHEARVHDMQMFLRRVGRLDSPEELTKVRNRNGCLGLLMVVRETFENVRWELLHEARALLGECAKLLLPGINVD